MPRDTPTTGDLRAQGYMLLNLEPDDITRVLIRGRYMTAVARMEHLGIPIDVEMFEQLSGRWDDIKLALIDEVNTPFDVYMNGTFSMDRWRLWLKSHGISWPTTPSGKLKLDDDTFKAMALLHPEIEPLRQLRKTLGKLRLTDLAVGGDGRNRTLLSPFRSRTGRNQPSNSRFVFGAASWLRALIKPNVDCGLAYIDYEQQEFAIAAHLSRDQKMIEAYQSGDPYLAFARQAGAVPEGATKHSHPVERERFKSCALAVLYGMGQKTLATRLGCYEDEARELLQLHRRTYPGYWRWSEGALDYALLHRRLHTALGWQIRVDATTRPTTLQNFPMQANGAEVLRLACIAVTEAGIRVCAPVHDALLIEAPLDDLDHHIEVTRNLMEWAGEQVISGTLTTDVEVIRYPDRYETKSGAPLWNIVQSVIRDGGQGPVHQCNTTRAPVHTRPISSI